MRIGEAAKRLNVTTQTVRTYIQQGKLCCDWTPNGQRVISEQQLNDFIGPEKPPIPERQPATYAPAQDANKN